MVDLLFAYNNLRHWQHCRQCGAYVKIECTRDYSLTFIVNWQPKPGLRQSHKYRHTQASRPIIRYNQ